jgi:hypothetical protein
MQIVKETCIDWNERRLIRRLYTDQSVKLRLDQGETRSVMTGREVRQGCCLSPILFSLYSEYLTKETLEEFGVFEIGGQIIARFAIFQFRHITKKSSSPHISSTNHIIFLSSKQYHITVTNINVRGLYKNHFTI